VVERGSTIGKVIGPYLVDPEPCVDLDTEHDFVLAEAVLKLLNPVGESR
jgi:CMP-N-acetylneuraminic acid synthetase